MVTMKGDFKTFMLIFIGTIVTATFIISIANSVVGTTTTITVTNVTVTAAAVNTTLDVNGRELLTTVEIYNASNPNATTNSLIGAGGSLQTGTGSNGLLSVQLILNDTASAFAGKSVNISYTANPDGYISSAGGRSVTRTITTFSALAIVVFILVMLFKGSLSNWIKFRRSGY